MREIKNALGKRSTQEFTFSFFKDSLSIKARQKQELAGVLQKRLSQNQQNLQDKHT